MVRYTSFTSTCYSTHRLSSVRSTRSSGNSCTLVRSCNSGMQQPLDNLVLMQSTYDCAKLRPGMSFDTVFVTAQGRCLEFAKCLVQDGGVLMIVSPGSGATVAARLNKYILYGDEVSIADVTAITKMFSLAGPESASVLEGLGASAPASDQVSLMGFQNSPVIVAAGGGLSGPGYTLIADELAAGELWRSLTIKGAVPMGTAAWEAARVLDGRPMAGKELTEQHLPLEAGLYHAVSLNKGCYMGQETLAKVHKLNAVKQQLHGLLLDADVAPGSSLLSGSEKAGTVTSVTQLPDGTYIGLGYVRCRANGVQIPVEGLQLTAGGVKAQVVSRPFASWHFPEGQGVQEPPPQSAGDLKDRALAAKASKEADKAAAAAAKEERLRVMQERLATWQASQAK
ncbi:hypothetical protein ABBQ32_009213 [Trebouxia sp. C0010 RCD-2024]